MSCPRVYGTKDQSILVNVIKEKLVNMVTEYRLDQDISQDELAKRIGMSHSAISKMEERKSISLEVLILSCEALGIEFNILKEIDNVINEYNLNLPSKIEHRHTGKYSRKDDINDK